MFQFSVLPFLISDWLIQGDDLSDNDSCSAATDVTSDNTLVELLETEV